MKILAGEPTGKHGKKAMSLDVGCMIPCNPSSMPGPRHRKFIPNGLALDNGAFSCHVNGRAFDGDLFKRAVAKIGDMELLFVVCPDKVMGGIDSLEFSEMWRPMVEYQRIALAVQDGMHGDDIEPIIDNYQYLFVGGSVSWKWMYAEYWVKWGHARGIPVHIGQTGQLGMLMAAQKIGADSVDSTSWCQNGTWWIVEAFRRNQIMELGLPRDALLEPPKSKRTIDNRWISRKLKH